MKTNKKHIFIGLIILILASLACGSVEIGVITPTDDKNLVNILDEEGSTPEVVVVETSQPTEEPQEDFSHLWVEYWNPVLNYGLAIPSHWRVETDSEGGFMMLWSYDQEFFQANSIKGNWIGGEAPEGVVKLDFVPFEDIAPEQSLATAISNIIGADPSMTVVLSVDELKIGALDAVEITQARPDNLEDTTTTIAFRLAPETILLVAAFPNSGLYSEDVQTIFSTLVADKSIPIVKPTTAPHPPLTVKNDELSGMPSASYPVAWYGHIASLPEGDSYDDKVVFPFNAGEVGIKGNTPEVEELIHSLRDATGEAEFVHLWGVLYCNIDDYNTCQFNVDRLEYGDQYTIGMSHVEKWVGKIVRTTYKGQTAYAFELSGGIPIWYGITSPFEPSIQDQIEALADSNTIVSVWGDMLVGVEDINGTRIEVTLIDPPSPGALPSSAACDTGYMSVLADTIDLITFNIEIGNYYPLSYSIGNPFVIGYWQSEGVSIPRDEAYRQLTEQYLPSPEEVVVITDPADFPDLYGMSVENMWGPDVDVAATLYSKGWGPDGQGEAILVIARCQADTYDAYFWYGMLYAGGGF